MMDYNYEVSESRPKVIIDLLHKHQELNDLNLGKKDSDEEQITGCYFGAMYSKYENRAGSEDAKNYGTNTYHKHDFRIRINGNNLRICKEHLKLLSTLSKELAPLG